MTFVVDGMLGNVARWLRLMGFDTLYFNTHMKTELLRAARGEGRVLLTCDRRLFRENTDISIFVGSTGTAAQLAEIKRKLLLKPDPGKFFTLCSLCNLPLETRKKAEVVGLVPEYVHLHKNRFRQCSCCKKVYWDGDHCTAIRKVLGMLMNGRD